MGFGDLTHDRQTEPSPVDGRLPAALESLEHALLLRLGDAGTLILDRHPDPGSLTSRRDPHLGAGGRHAQGVGEQVGERLPEAADVAEGQQAGRRRVGQPHVVVGGIAVELSHRLVRQLAEIHKGEALRAGLVTGEGDQIVDDARHPVHGPVHLLGHEAVVLHGGSRVGQGRVHVAADHRQRVAQLVRGVLDESPLRVEGAIEAVQHVVESVGETP